MHRIKKHHCQFMVNFILSLDGSSDHLMNLLVITKCGQHYVLKKRKTILLWGKFPGCAIFRNKNFSWLLSCRNRDSSLFCSYLTILRIVFVYISIIRTISAYFYFLFALLTELWSNFWSTLVLLPSILSTSDAPLLLEGTPSEFVEKVG